MQDLTSLAERAKSFCELTQKWNSALKRLYLLLRVFFWFLISLRFVREKTDKDIRWQVLSKAQGLQTSIKWKKLQPEKINDLTLSAAQRQTEAGWFICCRSPLHCLEECFRLIQCTPKFPVELFQLVWEGRILREILAPPGVNEGCAFGSVGLQLKGPEATSAQEPRN